MTQTVEKLNDVAQVYQNGIIYYREGADKVNDPHLKNLFNDLADAREVAMSHLAEYIEGRGAQVKDSDDMMNKMRRTMTTMDSWFDDNAESYLDGLEEQEDRTLEVLNEAIQKTVLPQNVAATLKAHREIFEETHRKMRSLKNQYDA